MLSPAAPLLDDEKPRKGFPRPLPPPLPRAFVSPVLHVDAPCCSDILVQDCIEQYIEDETGRKGTLSIKIVVQPQCSSISFDNRGREITGIKSDQTQEKKKRDSIYSSQKKKAPTLEFIISSCFFFLTLFINARSGHPLGIVRVP